MSIWITGYTEARIKDKWRCIDFYQYDTSGQLHHIPCIEGQSLVREALEWNCKADDIMGPPDDLSDEVRRMCTSKEGVLFGIGDQRWYSWRIVEGSWFAKANLSLPETCGFFPRQDVCNYLSNPDEIELDPNKVLSAEEYQALDAETKKPTSILSILTQAAAAGFCTTLKRLSWNGSARSKTIFSGRTAIRRSASIRCVFSFFRAEDQTVREQPSIIHGRGASPLFFSSF